MELTDDLHQMLPIVVRVSWRADIVDVTLYFGQGQSKARQGYDGLCLLMITSLSCLPVLLIGKVMNNRDVVNCTMCKLLPVPITHSRICCHEADRSVLLICCVCIYLSRLSLGVNVNCNSSNINNSYNNFEQISVIFTY